MARIRALGRHVVALALVAACGGGDGGAADATAIDAATPDATDGSIRYTVPAGGGTVTVPGTVSVAFEFPASAAGREITLTPTTAGSIGYPAAELDAVIALAPAGIVFADPVIVRPSSDELLVLHVPTGPGPMNPELLPLNADGTGLELDHFSTLGFVKLTGLAGWAAGTHSCTTGNPVRFSAALPTYCNTVTATCCAGSSALACKLRVPSLLLTFARLTSGAAAHCAAPPPADAGMIDASDLDAAVTDAAAVDAAQPADAAVDAAQPPDAAPMIDAGPGCAGTAGPTMVDVGGYCIDSTEVTNTHYAAFLTATSNDTSGQIAACAANADYTPAVADWATNEPTNKPGHPVGWVDWCDAYAYCAWAGKRLCGRIGGGAASYSEYATANVSQWHGACTAGGTQTYPYGNAFQLTSCNTRGSDGSGSSDGTTGTVLGRLPVGAKTSCQGGTAGVFDMSGNVLEWADECNGPNFTSRCHTRGGNSYASDQNARCDWSSDGQRSYTYEHLGFRCCSN